MTIRVLAFATLLLTVPAHAQELDYERAREALERNEVLPLAQILPEVERQTGARMIEVEFELEDDRYVYEFELVTADGRLIEAIVEAATGRIVSVGQEDDD
jgi:uncharacterized membrane protein YkoI